MRHPFFHKVGPKTCFHDAHFPPNRTPRAAHHSQLVISSQNILFCLVSYLEVPDGASRVRRGPGRVFGAARRRQQVRAVGERQHWKPPPHTFDHSPGHRKTHSLTHSFSRRFAVRSPLWRRPLCGGAPLGPAAAAHPRPPRTHGLVVLLTNRCNVPLYPSPHSGVVSQGPTSGDAVTANSFLSFFDNFCFDLISCLVRSPPGGRCHAPGRANRCIATRPRRLWTRVSTDFSG